MGRWEKRKVKEGDNERKEKKKRYAEKKRGAMEKK